MMDLKSTRSTSKLSLKRKKAKINCPSASSDKQQSSTCQAHSTDAAIDTQKSTISHLLEESKKCSNSNQPSRGGSRFSLVLSKIDFPHSKQQSTTCDSEAEVKQCLVEPVEESVVTDKVSADALESGEIDENDFKDPIPQLVRKKRKRKDQQEEYMQTIEKEQLQLALALSASIDRVRSVTDAQVDALLLADSTKPPPGKRTKKRRGKMAKQEETIPPLLAVSSQEAREILAQRAQDILKGVEIHEDEIQCTPAFKSSELGTYIEPLGVLEGLQKQAGSDQNVSNVDDGKELQSQASEAKCCGKEETDLMEVDAGLEQESIANENKSFASQFQHFDYPTMWELTSFEQQCEAKEFYVPALKEVVSPVKATCPIVSQSGALGKHTSQLSHNVDTSTSTQQETVADCTGVARLTLDLRALLGSSLFSDIEISTKEGSFISSHAVLLAARCPSLKALLMGATSHPMRLDFSDYEERVVLSFLEFVYTGALPIVMDHTEKESLTVLAKEWSLRELEAMCTAQSSTENVIPMTNEVVVTSASAVKPAHFEDLSQKEEAKSPLPLVEFGPKSIDEETRLSVCVTASPKLVKSSGSKSPKDNVLLIRATSSPEDIALLSEQVQPTCNEEQEGDATGERVEYEPVLSKSPEQVNLSQSSGSNSSITHKEMLKQDMGCSAQLECDSPTDIVDLLQSSGASSDHLSREHTEHETCFKESEHKHKFVLVSESPEQVATSSLAHLNPPNASPRQIDGTEDTMPVSSHVSVSSSHTHVSVSSSQSAELTENTLELELYYDSDELFSPASNLQGHSPSPLVANNMVRSPTAVISDDKEPNAVTPDKTTEGVSIIAQRSVSPLQEDVMGDDYAYLYEDPPEAFSNSMFDIATPHSDQTATPLHTTPQVRQSQGDKQSAPQGLMNSSHTPATRGVTSKQGARARDLVNTFRTPLGVGRFHLETDDDITPMPPYRTMVTPMLKQRCAKFGVKSLAKRKMIAKLEEIYNYTHPLVDAKGDIVEQTDEPSEPSKAKGKKTAKTKTTNAQNKEATHDDVKARVRASICSDKELYQDILLYKPLELAVIHQRLKVSGVSVSKEKLRDILDQWCVTFTIPRNVDTQREESTQQ